MAKIFDNKLALENDELVLTNSELVHGDKVYNDRLDHYISSQDGGQSDYNLLHSDALEEEVDAMVALD
jgi:hypothetical protein